ncbi:TonB-dependent receptor [Tenacibaculum maritimum]|uniref:TonB-dependent receptor n=1 Tax=Tenacibaculum maritimum TaxID=107401 RepID=UPI001E5DBA2C|nr:carboxypeptidase-like regulatory domain-containing protein [Tenacibaculum maritimum]MCD9563601.1 TonB-dependent receptor [Tenacibaculum maritimum]MCD9566853.1 TonB-dependent receptor [Tenacibaculum maritimum]MCD9580074.1 TonB-dependent receptor [Tenacibaculum maritimum]MCD9597606.1 TonB-dependent receptor [Tenacibaculum maritimum]MCD9614688.1 TonB-dependent receptor [Tenacibaculum maritimum]
MKKYIFSTLLLLPILLFSQNTFKGMIMDEKNPQDNLGVYGANVYWLGTKVGATTNEKGWFSIPYKKEYKKLIVSFVGYKTDTLTIEETHPIHHFIKEEGELDEISISTKRKGIQKSFLKAQNVFIVNSDELLKAACCNLSESFETNPSIDVNFSDALTGTKQIQMLGLTSPYLLISQENIPSVRGASQAFGLTFTPGTWVESIQITKGAGSVVNGYESISGQINAELVKPFSDKKFFLNAYGSLNGRLELNSHFNQKIAKKWQTGIYVHGNYRGEKFDRNKDNFLDTPLARQINVMNRWQYTDTEKGWLSFVNLRYLKDEKQMGEINFIPKYNRGGNSVWGSEIKTKRFDASAKIGYVFPELPFQSFGFQVSYSNHEQDSYFGLRTYDIVQESVYTNLLFNSIIGDTRSKFKTGVSFTYDKYGEKVDFTNYNRREYAIGTFFEYAYDNMDDFSFTAGIRADKHNVLGTFLTPRLHLRYIPWEKGVLRASVGRGRRSANIFAENQQLFGSSRKVNIEKSGGNIYGLDPEVAWNYGISFLQGFRVFDKKGDITLDYYITSFDNRVAVDWENSQEVSFYNVRNGSTAKSFQVEINYDLLKNLALRAAYKFYDISTVYKNGRLQGPLQAKNRFFANISYEKGRKERSWKYDLTYNLIGKQRLPNTINTPVAYTIPEYSKRYSLLNMQITRVFSKKFEVYLGGENITNYMQKNPILASEAPFGAHFDTSIVYAPVFGSSFYTGLRFKID